MQLIYLTPLDLMLAASLVVLLALVSRGLGLGLGGRMMMSGARMAIQLTLIGLVLKALFAHVHVAWVSLMALLMLTIAGREVMIRQHRRLTGWWGYGIGTLSMFISSFAVTVLALTVIVSPVPWYAPQYAIPLLGMLLGNTMNGIALGMDRLNQGAWDQRDKIEGHLMLGQDWNQAIGEIRRDSIRNGMIPIINAMAAAGIVSLPGMMTGQILSGTPPVEAVKYQILIMFLIGGGTGLGTVSSVWLGSFRLFDDRQRLRLERLRKGS